jgi:hypothetical protein
MHTNPMPYPAQTHKPLCEHHRDNSGKTPTYPPRRNLSDKLEVRHA